MKRAIFAAVCLSLVVCAISNDINVGARKPGDVQVASRRLYRHGIPFIPLVATTGYNADGVITAVSAVNANVSDAHLSIIKGGPGNSSVVLLAISKPGHGLDVKVDIYALLNNSSTGNYTDLDF